MLRIVILVAVCAFSALAGGCSGEKRPEADPNFKTSTNPSDISVPAQFKSKPQAPKS